MLKRAVIIAALLSASAQAQTLRPLKEMNFYGYPDHDSCGDWTLNRANRGTRTQALEGWVLGFVTGANFYGSGDGKTGADTNSTGMLAWVDRYCAENPLDDIVEASVKLVIELKKRRTEN